VQESAQEYESKGDRETSERRNVCRSAMSQNRRIPPPRVFVSVASKELSRAVSLLFATLAGRSTSVAAKGVREEEARKE
jgi:hypothetical protein